MRKQGAERKDLKETSAEIRDAPSKTADKSAKIIGVTGPTENFTKWADKL